MLWSVHHTIEKMVYWSEACACHDMPYNAEDQHRRWRRKDAWQKLMGFAFEQKTLFRACPAEGKRAPELAAGDLTRLASQDLDEIAVQVSIGMASLSEENSTKLMADLQHARGLIEFGLKAKLGHWGLIPWHLAGVLHHDLGVARACARACLQQWDQCPVEAEHHRVSNLFLSADSPLRPELVKFAAGTPWAEINDELVCAIAPLRWIPVVERLIEGRHAMINTRITGHKKRRHPTTVSLASGRLDEFSRRVTIRGDFMMETAEALKLVRSFRRAAETFAMMNHPQIEPLWRRPIPVHTHQWEPAVCEVFYRCDLESKHASKAELRKDIWAQRLAEGRLGREADKRGRVERANTRASVLQVVMHEHLIHRCKQEGGNFIFGVATIDAPVGMEAEAAIDPADQPIESVKVNTVAGIMHCPHSMGIPTHSALRRHEASAPLLLDTGADSDLDGNEAPPRVPPPPLPPVQDILWCQVVCASASKWKLVHVGAGVGRQLGPNDLVVSLHRHQEGVGMHASPMEVGSSGVDKVGILSSLDMIPEHAERSVQKWERSRHVFVIEGSFCDMKEADAVTALVSAGAFPNKQQHVVVDDTDETTVDQREIYRGLQERRHAERADDVPGGRGEQWALTAKGVANLRMVNCMANPQRIFVPPSTRPALEDTAKFTPYQLISLLESEGWTWRSLPKKKADRQALSFCLTDEEPKKHWCTSKGGTGAVHRSYLACLLHAPELLGAVGATALEHGKGATFYARLLKGQVARPRRAALLDDGGMMEEPLGDGEGSDAGSGDGGDAGDAGDWPDGSSDLTDMLEGILDLEEEEAAAEEARERDPDPGAEMPDAARTPSGASTPRAPSEAGSLDAELPDPESREAKALASARRCERALDRPKDFNFDWGAFRMTIKKRETASGGFSWSWQCKCPYHKKSCSSDCRKTLGMRFDTAVDEKERWDEECEATLLALKHWGNQALTKRSQGLLGGHLWVEAIHDLHPPAAVIEAQKLKYKPRLPVLVRCQTMARSVGR